MERTYRACLSSYIVLTICIGLTPAIALAIALRGDRDAAWVTIAGFAALLFTYFWLSRFHLTITPHSITYRSLFAGEHTIELSDITSRDIYWERGRYSRPLLELHVRGKRLRINYKVFSLEGAHALFQAVGPNQSLEPIAGRRDG
jgi:hypothetical protein